MTDEAYLSTETPGRFTCGRRLRRAARRLTWCMERRRRAAFLDARRSRLLTCAHRMPSTRCDVPRHTTRRASALRTGDGARRL